MMMVVNVLKTTVLSMILYALVALQTKQEILLYSTKEVNARLARW